MCCLGANTSAGEVFLAGVPRGPVEGEETSIFDNPSRFDGGVDARALILGGDTDNPSMRLAKQFACEFGSCEAAVAFSFAGLLSSVGAIDGGRSRFSSSASCTLRSNSELAIDASANSFVLCLNIWNEDKNNNKKNWSRSR